MIPTWIASSVRNRPIPPSPPLGPLDVVGRTDGFFTNFSQEFTLEADCAVVGLCCHFTGDPVITITHGADTLTILRQERSGNHLSLLAFGTGLVVETAAISVTATGGELNGGALRINEVYETSELGSTGWIDGKIGTGNTITPATQQDLIGGVVKGALVAGAADRYHTMSVEGAENVWSGFTSSGTPISTDTSTSGPWVLGPGWSIDGGAFVHTGAESELTLIIPATTGIGSTRLEATVDTGYVRVGSSSSMDRYGEGFHYICTAHGFSMTQVRISASGNCRLENITVVQDASLISWLFCSAPVSDGATIAFTQPYGPAWAYALAEVACPENNDM